MKKGILLSFLILLIFQTKNLYAQEADKLLLKLSTESSLTETPKVYEIGSDSSPILLAVSDDNKSYEVSKGAKIRIDIKAQKGNVNYLWFSDEKGSEQVIEKSYNLESYTIDKLISNTSIRVDTRELIPIKYICPSEGSNGKMVQIEEQDDYGTEIKPEADGITYMLPQNGAVYFDSAVDQDHFILCWLINGMPFLAKPDIFYKQNVSEGLELEVKFYKKGETRTINFTQPETAVVKCFNRSESDSPQIESGSKVTPGDEILFEISPFGNPSGKVEVHHWIVNGEPYMLGGQYYTDNSLSLFAFNDLDVAVVPMEEYKEPKAVISVDVEELNFDKIEIGSKDSKIVKVSTQNAQEDIFMSFKDDIKSLTISPETLPAEGGNVTITYSPTVKESIDTELFFKSGKTMIKVPVFGKSITSISMIMPDKYFSIMNNRIRWNKDVPVKIYYTNGSMIMNKAVKAGEETSLSEDTLYILDIEGHIFKVMIK